MDNNFKEGDDASVQNQGRTGARKKYVRGKTGYFLSFSARSKTGAGPGHAKSRYGANGLFSISTRVKSRYGTNGLFSIIFCSGPRPGHVESKYGGNGILES